MISPNPSHEPPSSNTTPAHGPRRPAQRGWILAIPLVAVLTLAGCSVAGSEVTSETTQASETETTSQVTGATDATATAADVRAGNQEAHDGDDDAEWSESDAVTIALDGDTAMTSDTSAVTVDDGIVTISAAGTYVLSGDYSGQVVVNSSGEGQVKLVLDGATIATEAGAAIDLQAADEAVVVLADGSTNSLSDASSYADDAAANAALYSAADLTITGTGSLEVSGNGNDGIASADGLVIQSGSIAVSAVDDGIRGKDYVVIRDGEITVEAGGDGIKSDNEEDATRGYVDVWGGTIDTVAGDEGIDAFTDVITTGGDIMIVGGGGADAGGDAATAKGIAAGVIAVLEGGSIDVDAADDAVHGDTYVHLAGATLTLATGDDGVHAEAALVLSAGDVTITESYEGIESVSITVTGGSADVVSSDDAVNGSVPGGGASEPGSGSTTAVFTMSGGELVLLGGGDGIDINGSWTQTGGTIVASGPNAGGDGAIDADGGIDISGGVLVAAGGAPEVPEESSALASVQFTFDAVAAGTVLTLVDSSGNALASFTTVQSTSGFLFTSADVVDGGSYALRSGGTAGDTIAGTYATGGDGGSSLATATAGQLTSTMGGGMGGGGMGGGGDGQNAGPGGGR